MAASVAPIQKPKETSQTIHSEAERSGSELAAMGFQPARVVAVGAPPPDPRMVLALQRRVGNQVVQRWLTGHTRRPAARNAADVQRQANPAADPDGGALDEQTAASIRRAQGGGRPLDGGLRRRMEQGFGADFSRVRVHVDGNADRLSHSLNAKAFTAGNNIFFRRNAFNPSSGAGQRLLAHELTHVVQQGGAKTGPVQAKQLNVGPVNDRYEEEANRVANQVMRSLQSPAAKSAVQRAPLVRRIQRQPVAAIQRFSLNPLKWTKKGREKAAEKEKQKKERQEKEKAESAELLNLATVFERRLGKYLFNHPRAQQAASTLADKMVAALIPDLDTANKEHQQEIVKAFGKDAKQYAGNVGTDFGDVWAALKQGNLREKMTAIYNAMFGSFKDLITRLMSEKAWGEAKTRGLDPRKLKIRKRQLKWNPMAKDPYRKPRAFLDRKKISTFETSLLKSGTRTLKEGSKVTKRTVGELEEGPFKAGLSPRERKFMFPNKSDTDDISGETLTWEEGGTTWDMKKNHKWVKTLTETRKMPVIAGPSGTAQRFFQLYEWLGKPVNAKDLRLALLGWMLVENDHSFHEIVQMGVEYGLPYTPGHAAYRNLDPLTEAEIRKNVNLDPKYPGLFPDEILYHKKLEAGEYALMKPYMTDLKERTEHAPLIEEQFGMKKHAYEKSGLKYALRPVTAYTTIAYQTINMVAGGSPRTTKMRLNAMMKTARTKHQHIVEAYRELYVLQKSKADLGDALYDEYKKAVDHDLANLSFAQKNLVLVLAYSPDTTVDQIIAEAKVHRQHVNSGLELLPSFQGKVYRGEAQNVGGHSYKKGTKVTVKKFLSASRNDRHAVSYAKSSAGITNTGKKWYAFLRKPFVLEIESRTARDVNAVTINEDEEVRQKTQAASLDEVVFLPGTVLEVQNDPKPDSNFDNIPKVELKEIKGGGVTDPNLRIEYNQTDVADISGPALDEDEEESDEDVGLTYEAKDELNIARIPPNVDQVIKAGEQFQVLDEDWESNYKDPATEWVEIRYRGHPYHALVYDLLLYAFAVSKPTEAPKPAPKPQPKPVALYVAPDEDAMNFALTDADKIESYSDYDLQPGWSQVVINDEDGRATYFAKTNELVEFLSGVAEALDEDVTESAVDEEAVEARLDPADYPAGDYPLDITLPINLPASTTEDGKYTTSVELFPGDKITAHVTDDLTANYGRCRIVFYSHTYYVPLQMLVPKATRSGEHTVGEVDEENLHLRAPQPQDLDEFVVEELNVEEFVPENKEVTLKVIAGRMDLDPEEDTEVVKNAEPIEIPLSQRDKIRHLDDKGAWVMLQMEGSFDEFYFALASDWETYQKA